MVLDGRTVWFAGGYKDGYKGHTIAEVWSYDIDDDRYTVAPLLPETRGGGGLALVGRTLHYMGGVKADRDTDASDHWVLDLDEWAQGSAQWTDAAPMPEPRNQFSCVTFEGRIYAIGGQFPSRQHAARPGPGGHLRPRYRLLECRPLAGPRGTHMPRAARSCTAVVSTWSVVTRPSRVRRSRLMRTFFRCPPVRSGSWSGRSRLPLSSPRRRHYWWQALRRRRLTWSQRRTSRHVGQRRALTAAGGESKPAQVRTCAVRGRLASRLQASPRSDTEGYRAPR